MSDTLYEKVISENLDKAEQYRLVISEFRDEQYLHLRKYFLSYEGEWLPSKEGATIPATIESVFALLEGLLEICSHEEGSDIVSEFLKKKLNDKQTT